MSSQGKIHSLLLLCSFFLLCSCDFKVTKYNTDAEIEHLMIKHDLPSISACVIKNNSIVWQCIYGFSNRETQLEATQETIYHIASISKLFIVTAFMQLEEQGIVDLNQDINEYLPISIRNPNFPDKPITSMMLLTHTASLASTKTDADAPGIWKEFQTDQAPPLSEWIPQFLIPSGKFYSPTIWKLYEPKQLELYSNVGSCLLAYIAEQLTGQDFRDYCRDHIFGPLAMRNTSYLYSDLDRNKIAILYQNNNAVHLFFDFLLNASGGAKTTINDMARFLIAYMNGGELDGMRVLAESSVEKILTVQNNISGRCLTWSASFGGWFGHSGGLDAGAKSIAEIHPQSKIGFIIFCNKSLSPIDHGDEIYGLVRQKANEYIE